MMYDNEAEERFIAFAHVRRCDKCCGNCKYFERDYEDAGCAHPKQAEFDSWDQLMRKEDPYHVPESYGAYGGTGVDEGFICDLWEARE